MIFRRGFGLRFDDSSISNLRTRVPDFGAFLWSILVGVVPRTYKLVEILVKDFRIGFLLKKKVCKIGMK